VTITFRQQCQSSYFLWFSLITNHHVYIVYVCFKHDEV
jgi:hypothetical protein